VRAVATLVVAALLAGCAAPFPDQAPAIATLDVGELGPGAYEAANFTLGAPAQYLFVGFRAGEAADAHVTLLAPNGTRYDTAAGDPEQPCLVAPAPAGPWRLEVATDPPNGSLHSGRYVVRASDVAPPGFLACANDVFPGRAMRFVLAHWNVSLAAGSFDAAFLQPYALAALNVSSDAPNASVYLAAPGAPYVPAENLTGPPAIGTWNVRASWPNASTGNASLVIRGIGA
jgi:hypothetical protein